MLDAKKALIIAQQYVDESLDGVGTIAGKPCQIQSINKISGGNKITFLWVDNSNVSHTSTLNVMDGDKGDKGDKGDVGERGATGNTGDTATVTVGSVTSGTTPSVTNVGTNTDAIFDFVLAKGDKGDKGDAGEDGQDGKSFEIKAQYPTYQSLITAHPTGDSGDAYFVGTDDNPDLYIWLTESNEWFNSGKIAGVKGDKGDKGDDGFSPVASVSKSGDIATIVIRDKTGQTTAQISDGKDGKNAQFTTLPVASATNEGQICQYVGETIGGLKNGHFYKCVESSGSFIWIDIFGNALEKNFTDHVRPDNHDLVESNAVYSAINNALSSVYVPHGNLLCAELTSSLLIAENVGNVYNMNDSGTTSSLFINGAGITINENDSVGIIKAGAESIMFNYMGNLFDMHTFQNKNLDTPITIGGTSQTTVENALNGFNNLVPSDASSSNKLITSDDIDATATTSISGIETIQSVGTINGAWICRSGNVVQLRISISGATLTIASNSTLKISLPNSVPKPVMETWGVNDHYNDQVDESASLRFTTSGEMFIYTTKENSPTENAIVNIGVTYITRE